jgi:hypothetical protein
MVTTTRPSGVIVRHRRSGSSRERLLGFLIAVDVDDDGDGTAIADEEHGLSAGDEGDEAVGGLAGDGKNDGGGHSPIVLPWPVRTGGDLR